MVLACDYTPLIDREASDSNAQRRKLATLSINGEPIVKGALSDDTLDPLLNSELYKFARLGPDSPYRIVRAVIEPEDQLGRVYVVRFWVSPQQLKRWKKSQNLTEENAPAQGSDLTLARAPLNGAWVATLASPHWLASFDFYSDQVSFVFPSWQRLNERLRRQVATELGSGPRFRPVVGPNIRWQKYRRQKYTRDAFFEALLDGEVLVATRGPWFEHDFLASHAVGALIISRPAFLRFQGSALFLSFLSDQTYNLAKIIRPKAASLLPFGKSPFLARQLQNLFATFRDQYSDQWDHMTENFGVAVASRSQDFLLNSYADYFFPHDSPVATEISSSIGLRRATGIENIERLIWALSTSASRLNLSADEKKRFETELLRQSIHFKDWLQRTNSYPDLDMNAETSRLLKIIPSSLK